MASTLFMNIQLLAGIQNPVLPLRGAALATMPFIENAYLLVEDDEIAGFGTMAELASSNKLQSKDSGLPTTASGLTTHDVSGQILLPAWCDSHTHLVFAASRENEFVDKLKGLSYADIAAGGGGILHSAKKLQAATEDELFNSAWRRMEEISRMGTGAVEIKSGYGLTVEDELKMLRVIKKIKQKSRLLVKSTFLGAHTYPLQYKDNHQGYIDLIIQEMLPVIAAEQLADYIDVFCETGFFTAEETSIICRAGMQYGLKPKIHANQLTLSGGVQAGIALSAVSVDHLETMDNASIQALAQSRTIGTILPTAAFFLRMPYQPARQMLKAGCALALASDFNPGSSPSGNMNLVVAMACIQMKLLPEEAINAATINGAFAMELAQEAGSIALGKKANLVLTKPLPNLASLPYFFGSNCIDKVMIAGEWV